MAALLPLLALTGLTSCDIYSRDWHWTRGKTHGVIVETTAARASLGIYRVPSQALKLILDKKGIRFVQDTLWSQGKPPEAKFTLGGVTVHISVATAASRAYVHWVIYDDAEDLRGAINQAHQEKNCLAVTLISAGKPTKNWTSKSVGCQDGALVL